MTKKKSEETVKLSVMPCDLLLVLRSSALSAVAEPRTGW
jgi:hypothetical protein